MLVYQRVHVMNVSTEAAAVCPTLLPGDAHCQHLSR